jgi:hypothetical protein
MVSREILSTAEGNLLIFKTELERRRYGQFDVDQ